MTRAPIDVNYSAPLRTKIVATLGPASSTAERLRELFAAGVSVCRLNFSHGSQDEHARTLALVRSVAKECDLPIAVLGDLCGPKIRLNQVAPGIELATGATVRFVRGDGGGTPETLTVSYPPLIDEVEVGQRVLIDDGLVRLLVIDKTRDELICRVTAGGTISTRKGVNLPDTPLSVAALTDKDRSDARWAVTHELDYVALSFARRPADLHELQELLRTAGNSIPVIVKVEKSEAIDHLDTFIRDADGIMIARGDMGVEIDIWQVPLIQKHIARQCRLANKPVIVATQMLQSMIESPTPTRAEVSDVANAILDRADGVMLSAESAAGLFPVHAVEMMARIARTVETYLGSGVPDEFDANVNVAHRAASAIVHGAVRAAQHLRAKVVAVWSTGGTTARMVSQYRLPVPVVGLTHDPVVARRMNLYHGILPVIMPEPEGDPARMATALDRMLIARKLAATGDLIVVVTSTRPTVVGATDSTLIHRVGDGADAAP